MKLNKIKIKPTYKENIYSSDFNAKGTRLVYGTSGLGGVWGDVDARESIDCLLYAFENGITSLDTSPSYSNSEMFVGKALAKWKGQRPFISTKVGRLQSASAFEAKLDYSLQGMTDSVNRSLDLLGVESIDLLFLHEPQWAPLDRMEEIIDTLQSFKADGKVKMLGIGGNPSLEFRPYINGNIFEVISTFCRMDACNLEAFDEEIGIYKKENIAIYAASALHFSLLGNRFETYTQHPPTDTEYITDKEISIAIKVNEIAKKNNISLPTLAQRYLFSIEEATRVVVGARRIYQIENTIKDWKQGALSEDIFNEITNAIMN
jgi:aryl-alcohol dehydrogenase-like predicted oxidoreductase